MPSSSGIKAGKAFIVIDAIDKSQAVLNKIGKKLQSVAHGAMNLGKSLIGFSAAMLTPALLSLKVFSSFDDSMRKVGARSTGTAKDLEGLRSQAKELGRTTSFTATQVAELQAKLAQKGFDRTQIKAMTQDVLNLARAAGEGGEQDTVMAADIISGTLRSFQMEAGEAGKVSDIMATAVNNSNFSLESLGDGLKTVAPLASDFNLSLEETIATLASMTNVNVNAAESGNALKTFFARMSKGEFTNGFNKQLEELTGKTIKFADESGNLRKPLTILEEIGKATEGLGSAEKADLLSKLFGVFQFGKASAAMGQASDMGELLSKLQNSSGNAGKAAAEMDAGIGGSFRKTMSAIEGVAIVIGEALDGPMSAMLDWVSAILPKIGDWIAQNSGLIRIIAGVAAGIGVLGGILFTAGASIAAVSFAVSGLIIAVKAVIGFLGALVSIPGLIVAALLVLSGVIIYLSRDVILTVFKAAYEWFISTFGSMLGTIQKTLGGIIQAIAQGDLQAAFKILWLGLKLLFLQGSDLVMGVWDSFILRIKNTFSSLGVELATITAMIWHAVMTVWNDFTDQLLTKVGLVVGAFRAVHGLVAAASRTLGKSISAKISSTITTEQTLAQDRNKAEANENAAKRKAGIAQTQAELNKALADLKKSGEKLPEPEEQAKTIKGFAPAKVEGITSMSRTPATTQSTGVVSALRKNSLEALKQFQQNTMNAQKEKDTVPKKQLAETKKTNQLLENGIVMGDAFSL